MNHEQFEIMKRHLMLVFKHEIDPSAGSISHQNELNEIHHQGTTSYGPNSALIRC